MKPQFHQEKLNKKIYFNKIYVERFTWMFEKINAIILEQEVRFSYPPIFFNFQNK